MTSCPAVITIEEHFTSPKLYALRGEKDTPVQRMLDDLGELRIRELDEAGIDLQVISENNPATQDLAPKSPSSSPAPPTMCCAKLCAHTSVVQRSNTTTPRKFLPASRSA